MSELGLAVLWCCTATLLVSSSFVPAWAGAAAWSCDQSAVNDREVRVFATTEPVEAASLLAGFHRFCPGVQVIYQKLSSGDLYDRVIGGTDVDLAWSSALDLQIKLVNDGYAQPYRSVQADNLPAWAVWRDEAYGTTAESVTFVYNRTLLAASDVPTTHKELTHLLMEKPDVFQGRVATYDPERSGSGFLFITQDLEVTRDTWTLVRALGQTGVKLYSSTDAMLDGVATGELLLAYNVIGSYAKSRAARGPALGVVSPSDYTLVISRVAFIAKAAPHVNAARAFLDYLLSVDGQNRLAAGFLDPVREAHGISAAGSALQPIRLGPGLLTYLDQAKRMRFIRDWQSNLQGQPSHRRNSAP